MTKTTFKKTNLGDSHHLIAELTIKVQSPSWVAQKNRQRNRESRSKLLYLQLVFNKDTSACQWKKESLFSS